MLFKGRLRATLHFLMRAKEFYNVGTPLCRFKYLWIRLWRFSRPKCVCRVVLRVPTYCIMTRVYVWVSHIRGIWPFLSAFYSDTFEKWHLAITQSWGSRVNDKKTISVCNLRTTSQPSLWIVILSFDIELHIVYDDTRNGSANTKKFHL